MNMTTMAMEVSTKAINKWFYFSMNYPSDFIEKVWGPKTPCSLSEHLQNKFNGYWEDYGSSAVMNVFYASLDNSNRIKLLTWVMENYSDEISLRYDLVEEEGEL